MLGAKYKWEIHFLSQKWSVPAEVSHTKRHQVMFLGYPFLLSLTATVPTSAKVVDKNNKRSKRIHMV